MTVKCGGESEIDVELEEDGSLALSSLKALYSNATGLFFSSESGRRRSVRVVDNKCFPPQGKWGERVYKVVVPETDVNEATPASTSANICVSTSVPNPLFTAVSNISATGGSSVVSRTNMIGCDSKTCAIKWYHFSCAGISETDIPQGLWYCNSCSKRY